MLYVKAWHIIAMVAWFAGLFYLPRLFVYHAAASDSVSLERFIVMERRLYYAIMWPAAVLTTGFGIVLMTYQWTYLLSAGWFHAKLGLIVLLWIYHGYCGYFVGQFKRNTVQRSSRFFRFFNEIPTLLLVGIVMLVVVRP